MLGVEAFRRLLDRESFPVGPDNLALPGVDVDMVQYAEDQIKRLDRLLSLGGVHPIDGVVGERAVLDGMFRAPVTHRMRIALLLAAVARLTIESSSITVDSTLLQPFPG